jgi:hypothetical protein
MMNDLTKCENAAKRAFKEIESKMAEHVKLEAEYNDLKRKLAAGGGADTEGAAALSALRERAEIQAEVVALARGKWAAAMAAVDSERAKSLDEEAGNIVTEYPILKNAIDDARENLERLEAQMRKNRNDKIETAEKIAAQASYNSELVHCIPLQGIEDAEQILADPLSTPIDVFQLTKLIEGWRKGFDSEHRAEKVFPGNAYLFVTKDGEILDVVIRRYVTRGGKTVNVGSRMAHFQPEHLRARLERKLTGEVLGASK